MPDGMRWSLTIAGGQMMGGNEYLSKRQELMEGYGTCDVSVALAIFLHALGRNPQLNESSGKFELRNKDFEKKQE